MGMYDTVHMNGKDYQTKHFDGLMDSYEIVNDRLYFREYEREWVDSTDDLFELGGYIDSTFVGLREMSEYTGTIRMIDSDHTLYCVFCSGRLVHVHDNTDGRYKCVNHFLTEKFCSNQ